MPYIYILRFLRHLTLPIIPSGAASSNRLPAIAPIGIGAPAELHPPPDGASAEGVAVTTTTTTAGVCVGGSGAVAGAGAAVGASARAGGAGVSVGAGVAVGTGV